MRIYSKLSYQLKKRFNKNYPSANHFAELAAIPDTWRKRTLHDIFKRYDATLPAVLQPYADETTDSWHYFDQPYGNTHCPLPKNRNIIWAINIMQKAWSDSHDPNSKALIMVFLEHFIGDIHQPLHTFSRYNAKCRYDLGGNDFYVKSGRHPTTLHKLWDKGVGYLTHKINFFTKAKRLQHEFPKNQFAYQLRDNSPADWAKNELEYAPFIYSAKANKQINRHYYQRGQWIVRRQLALAGYRLAGVLQQLF